MSDSNEVSKDEIQEVKEDKISEIRTKSGFNGGSIVTKMQDDGTGNKYGPYAWLVSPPSAGREWHYLGPVGGRSSGGDSEDRVEESELDVEDEEFESLVDSNPFSIESREETDSGISYEYSVEDDVVEDIDPERFTLELHERGDGYQAKLNDRGGAYSGEGYSENLEDAVEQAVQESNVTFRNRKRRMELDGSTVAIVNSEDGSYDLSTPGEISQNSIPYETVPVQNFTHGISVLEENYEDLQKALENGEIETPQEQYEVVDLSEEVVIDIDSIA